MFADDTRIMAAVKDELDVEAMQEDLNKVYKWADSNNMEFNSNLNSSDMVLMKN